MKSSEVLLGRRSMVEIVRVVLAYVLSFASLSRSSRVFTHAYLSFYLIFPLDSTINPLPTSLPASRPTLLDGVALHRRLRRRTARTTVESSRSTWTFPVWVVRRPRPIKREGRTRKGIGSTFRRRADTETLGWRPRIRKLLCALPRAVNVADVSFSSWTVFLLLRSLLKQTALLVRPPSFTL
jgi:hypothetical protein